MRRRHPSLADHPGYLGMTSQGIIAIHAEGPLYQLDHRVMAVASKEDDSFDLWWRFRAA